MRRITVSLDDDLARLAEAEVKAGRAPSVSAWIADAIRAKAQARTELIADFEELERRDPTPPQTIESTARVLGISPGALKKILKGRHGRPGARRAA
jgi:Arc/MetJ-type ribon-helix-helix transcriptional regulator